MAGLVRAGLLAVAVLVAQSGPAQGQITSRPRGEAGSYEVEWRGLYVGIGGDIGVQFASGFDAKLSYGGEVKLGYSVHRGLQIYLSGSYQQASYGGVLLTTGTVIDTQKFILATGHLRQALYTDPSGFAAFVSGGIGVGFVSPGVGPSGATAIGLGYSGGFGVEIPVSGRVVIVPEFYYRGVTNASGDNGASLSVSALGLQLGLAYY
jgi:hypothetical protein